MTQGLELRGAVLGKGYRLGRRLEVSPQTTDDLVHEATHERIPGRFLIRLFPPDSLTQPEAASRIQRGARVASLLRDPHAVQVLDCNTSGEVPAFVVLERVQGRSLADVLAKEDARLPLPRVVEVVESLAAALAAAHQIGLVHGDIHPAHVILPTQAGAGQPAAKLSGFGWAKEWRAAARGPAASPYLAPEQEAGKVLTLDERADQYGLAVLAYQAISGRFPFPISREATEGSGGDTGAPPALAELLLGIPAAVDDVLRQALAHTPSDRFASITDLAARLREAALSRAVEASADDVADDVVEDVVEDHLVEDDDDDDEHDEHEVATARGRVEETDDAKLVLGQDDVEGGISDATDEPDDDAAEDPPIPDDARTQIVRSPFFEEHPAAALAVPIPPPPATTPRRGIPIGRPPVRTLPRGARAGRMSSSLPRAPKTNPGLGPPLGGPPRRLTPVNWPQVLRNRWAVPSAMGAGFVILLGATIWIGTRAAEVPPGRAPVAAVPAAPAVAPLRAMPPPVVVPAPAAPPAAAPTSVAASPPLQPPTPVQAPTAVAPPVFAAPQPPQALAPPSTPANVAAAAPAPQSALAAAAVPAARAVARRPPPVKTPSTTPARPAPPAATGKSAPAESTTECSIHISSRPWAEVWIDGKNTGRKTPLDKLKVSCGTRKLELKRPDKDIEQMEMLQVVPGKPFRGNYELE